MENPNTLSTLGNQGNNKLPNSQQSLKNSKQNTTQKTQSYSFWCETTKDWKIQKKKQKQKQNQTQKQNKNKKQTKLKQHGVISWPPKGTNIFWPLLGNCCAVL
jgi:hypothetical protein